MQIHARYTTLMFGPLALTVLVLSVGCESSPWSLVESPARESLLAVHGSSENDVWAVGRLGEMVHWDGEEWSEVDSGTEEDLMDVWAVSHDKAWVVGTGSTFLHWDGTNWSDGGFPQPNSHWSTLVLSSVWSDGVDLYVLPAVGVTLNDTNYSVVVRQTIGDPDSWIAEHLGASLSAGVAIEGAANEIWAIGEEGFFAHKSGNVWSVFEDGPDLLDGGWNDIAVLEDGTAWAVGQDSSGTQAIHWDGGRWDPCSPEAIDKVGFPTAIWSDEDRTVVVSSWGIIARFGCEDGMIEYSGTDESSPEFNDVWGVPGGAMWAVGRDGLIVHSIE